MSSLGKSILLVDDDQEIRELLDIYLTRAGFQVSTVSDGAGFRKALEHTPCDLLILDVMLPDEDGFSLCRWVRQHPRCAQTPIIMLTASSDETDRVLGLELGADNRSAPVNCRRGSRRCCGVCNLPVPVPVTTSWRLKNGA